MSKKILILSTSPRKGSNSEALADEFLRGAAEMGHQVEKISLAGKDIQFCRGCFACQKLGHCVMDDDASKIEAMMAAADVLVFATPIYYYTMCGQMKTMLDRGNPLFVKDYAFREVYLISTAAEDGDHVWERAKTGLEGWIKCFPKARLAGCVFGGNVTEPNTIRNSPAMAEAYALGKSV